MTLSIIDPKDQFMAKLRELDRAQNQYLDLVLFLGSISIAEYCARGDRVDQLQVELTNMILHHRFSNAEVYTMMQEVSDSLQAETFAALGLPAKSMSA